MCNMLGWLLIYIWSVLGFVNIFSYALSPEQLSVFDVALPQILYCNATVCDDVKTELTGNTGSFLDTAPCPPEWNMSLICQRNCVLDCTEVAAILDRCIALYDLDCEDVFSALETCVCDFNMSCPAMNNTYEKNCGWKEMDNFCETKSISLGSTLVVTISNSGSSEYSTTLSPDGRQTTGQTWSNDITDDINSTGADEPTTLIEESRQAEEYCNSLCIVLAVTVPIGVVAVVLVALYHCHKGHGQRSGKTAPVPSITGIIESKQSKNAPSYTIHPDKEKHALYPSMEKSLTNRNGTLTIGRPCNGFSTNMFEKAGHGDFNHYQARTVPVERAWEEQFQPALSLVDSGSMLLKIPRPSLVTFKYSNQNQQLFDNVEYCTNPLYEESAH